MNADVKLLKYLELTYERVKRHHNALWEEEKHYSWWVYIILAGVAFLYVTEQLTTPVSIHMWEGVSLTVVPKVVLIYALSSFGICLSVFARQAIYIEGKYYDTARKRYDRLTKALGLDKPVQLPKQKPLSLKVAEFKPKIAIRRFFRATFVLATALFVSLIVLACLTF